MLSCRPFRLVYDVRFFYILFLCGKKKNQKEAIGGSTPFKNPPCRFATTSADRVVAYDGIPATRWSHSAYIRRWQRFSTSRSASVCARVQDSVGCIVRFRYTRRGDHRSPVSFGLHRSSRATTTKPPCWRGGTLLNYPVYIR